MEFLASSVSRFFGQKALGQIAILMIHEAAKHSHEESLHQVIHFIAPFFGVDLPADLVKQTITIGADGKVH